MWKLLNYTFFFPLIVSPQRISCFLLFSSTYRRTSKNARSREKERKYMMDRQQISSFVRLLGGAVCLLGNSLSVGGRIIYYTEIIMCQEFENSWNSRPNKSRTNPCDAGENYINYRRRGVLNWINSVKLYLARFFDAIEKV